MPETRLSPDMLQEKLESLVGVLHITRRDTVKQEMSVTPQLQTGSFRDSDVSVRLVTDWVPAPPETSML